VSSPRIAVVTGATEGIGKETAAALLRKGFFVVVHGRSEARARAAADDVAKTKSEALDVAVADFSSMKETQAMGESLVKKHPRIDVLLNNAGVFMKERTVTADGFELTLAVNHFAHFVLTHALIGALGASDQGRIVHVASGVHSSGHVALENLTFERDFSGYDAYASSKLMNVLFSNELARRLRGTRITSNALHPGVIATKLLRTGFGAGGASVASGARTSVKVATDSALAETTGAYFSDEREVSCSPRAKDPKLAGALYERSCALTGTPPILPRETA
jgi:NAD(P)-dependent dehydrogenase (short-subunit alcohol dehydrogenase family)